MGRCRFYLLAPSNCEVLNFDHVLPIYNVNEALINFVTISSSEHILLWRRSRKTRSTLFLSLVPSSGLDIGWANTSRDWRSSSVKVSIYSTQKCVSEIKKQIVIGRQYLDVLSPLQVSNVHFSGGTYVLDLFGAVYTQFMIWILWDLCDQIGALFFLCFEKDRHFLYDNICIFN